MSSIFPATFAVGNKGHLSKFDPALYDNDPRGIVWMWEPPRTGHLYFMGIDASVGRTNWSRESRSDEDEKTDNGAIQVIRKGRSGSPDTQVCEFAAPVDSFELGYIANILGRIYGRSDEDNQCKCIIETYPGPGSGTLQTMLQLGYTNLWKWEYYADSIVKPTQSIGWQASPKNNSNLWAKGSRLINLHKPPNGIPSAVYQPRVIIRSPFLMEECADLEILPGKGWAEASNGAHDDRVRAYLLALWAANGWSVDVETIAEPVTHQINEIDWQASDMSMEEIMEGWHNVLDRMEYLS